MMISKNELEEMYHGKEMSASEIANNIGVTQRTVFNWMQKLGIKSRTISEALSIDSSKPSKKELGEMYYNKKMSSTEIAHNIGVAHSTVLCWMQELGIVIRTRSEVAMINLIKPSKAEIEEMYWYKEMSVQEIANDIGVSSSLIFRLMEKYMINTRTKSESLLVKYGGISFLPYCSKFNNKFKESVRERDNYTCQLCHCVQSFNDERLSVHHIHYDKENCYPDVVALCRSCNAKVNGNRDYWEQYFENLLFEKGMLDWTIEKDKININIKEE